jgi:hypothetical protein
MELVEVEVRPEAYRLKTLSFSTCSQDARFLVPSRRVILRCSRDILTLTAHETHHH